MLQPSLAIAANLGDMHLTALEARSRLGREAKAQHACDGRIAMLVTGLKEKALFSLLYHIIKLWRLAETA